MSESLAEKSIEQLAPLIKSRTISPVEIVHAIFQEIEQKNSLLNAYIHIDEMHAREAAERAEVEIMSGNYRGPLHGIPMALKDNLYIKGKPATVGSKIHQHFTPTFDATVVKRLKEQGVIFTGSLNMHEYALGITTDNPYYGTCRNPWDVTKIPSGSSGGSAAAVSAHLTTASLGTETGGSIRTPSSVCGIVGLKPTFGRVSRHGCFPASMTLDHIGPMTKSVYDAALLLEVIAGKDEKDPYSLDKPVDRYRNTLLEEDLSNVVVGICEDFFFYDVDPEIETLVKKAILQLEKRGVKFETVRLANLKDAYDALTVIMTSEVYLVHEENVKTRPEDFGKDILSAIQFGATHLAIDYLKAINTQRNVRTIFKDVFKRVDVLIAPTMPFTAATIGDDRIELNGRIVNYSEHASRFIRPGTLAGIPAITVPCGLKDGMPVGLQVMGDHFNEALILQVAYNVEKLSLFKGDWMKVKSKERD